MTTRDSLAEVFEQAKQHLWDGETLQSPYPTSGATKKQAICNAIWLTNAPQDLRLEAQGIVTSRIHPYSYLPSWLDANGVPFDVQTRPLVQAHRKQWLDLLAEEFSNVHPENAPD